MQEILFRGKNNDGKWVCGAYFHKTLFYSEKVDEHLIIEYGEFDYDRYYAFEVIPATVGQYTGLTDKNGTKIFEGDILKGRHDWHNFNTSFGNDEQDFLEQNIRGAYGKYINKEVSDVFGQRYHYFRNYAVEYYAPNGGYRVRNGGCFHALTRNYIISRDLEVIGNIHDNPELLKTQ